MIVDAEKLGVGLLTLGLFVAFIVTAPDKPKPKPPRVWLVIVGREGCPSCRQAVQDAKTVGVPVRYFDVTKGVPHVVLVRDGACAGRAHGAAWEGTTHAVG
jgi:hypothetical protein